MCDLWKGHSDRIAILCIAGGMIPLIYFLRKNSSILRLGETKFEGKVLIKATSNGLSEFMTNISMSIVAILFNSQLMKYSGENGVAAYGVMMYVSMIFTAVFVGFSIGASPVISFHFGAKNTDELKNLIRKSIVIVGTFGIIMVIAAEIFAGGLAKILLDMMRSFTGLPCPGSGFLHCHLALWDLVY